MKCQRADCDRDAEEGADICFTHRIKSVGFNFRGGGIDGGRKTWNQTTREWHEENLGVESGKELARTRPDVGRFDG